MGRVSNLSLLKSESIDFGFMLERGRIKPIKFDNVPIPQSVLGSRFEAARSSVSPCDHVKLFSGLVVRYTILSTSQPGLIS